MDIIRILWIHPHFVDIIRIDQITRYLSHNVCHVLHTFFLAVDIIYIGRILHSFIMTVKLFVLVTLRAT